ncbi:SDR family oxidoreductase [Rhodopseudomonas palustris]|uniref:SDR family oxidoreductase n=1 Tax=Thiospirillum jenense TaxID=1653858 RepID=A0A839HK81_9GAMM|nr:SDR family NAD(P)-dependent oxidoreductase [Thiospirillum jenense]MBB1093065.1 SDR family oxidoreductase [Rhodopseudomonas palustris]MBB1127138.1 SDR family oxidoreductase [Thiospirillum jenense]
MSDLYQPAADCLANRRILVTGAAEGIGRAVAIACARYGATVIVSDFDDTDLDGTYDLIEASGAPQPALLPLDLERGDAQLFLNTALALGNEFAALDGLVHCAAYTPYLGRIDDYDPSDWERVLRVNLTAAFLLTQACLPLLYASGEASVVFTSDRVGRHGLAYWGAYAAAKCGLEGLMQTLAAETADAGKVRVNSLEPGVVQTAMRRALYPAENPYHHPPPETVAASYLYLLSAESRGVTGQQLTAPLRVSETLRHRN